MKIAIPTADYPPIEGGISSVSLHVSRELAALGHDVTVIAPWFPNMRDFDADEPVKVIRFGGYHLGWFRFIPMLLKSRSPIRSADLTLGINIAYGGAMAWFLGAPYLTFAYAYEFLKFQRVPVLGSMLRRVYSRSIKAIAISRFTAEQLASFGVDTEKIATILPGAPKPFPVLDEDTVAVKELLGLKDGPLLLAVGRLIIRKGHATLLKSMPAVLARFPDTRLVIVGRGPMEEQLRNQINELGLNESVLMPGYLDDKHVAALYQLCDVFTLPTGEDAGGHVEGFGLVFAEANAYGKPVVAGRSGGVTDAVVDGETGILVEPDDADACANAIISLLDNPDAAQTMGEAGRNRVESELNWREFVARMMAQVEADDV